MKIKRISTWRFLIEDNGQRQPGLVLGVVRVTGLELPNGNRFDGEIDALIGFEEYNLSLTRVALYGVSAETDEIDELHASDVLTRWASKGPGSGWREFMRGVQCVEKGMTANCV